MINNNNQKGYVLVSVITLSALIFILGSSAVYMTSMGAQTVSSEMQYSKAKEASEIGLNKAVAAIAVKMANNDTDSCNNISGNAEVAPGTNITYNYSTAKDNSGNNCFIYSVGKITGTKVKVVKTAIVPVKLSVSNSGADNSAMRTGSISNVNVNGANISIGNNCGGPGVVTQNIQSTAKTNLEKPNGSSGTPPVLVNQDLPNIYTSTFGTGIINRTTLNAAVDVITTLKMADPSIPSNCKVNPLNLPNTNCDTNNQGKIVCSGGVNKTIDPDSCPEVVIQAASFNVGKDMPSTTNFTVNVSNNINIQSSIKGLISSKNVLNINSSGNPSYEGIFLGADANNLNVAGNISFKGLYFIGNDNHNSNLNMNLSGNTSILGSIVVDGNINNMTRNGGGNAGGNDYNIQYNADVINNWGTMYAGLLTSFGCGGNTGTPPSIKGMLNGTKLTMF